MSKPSLRVGLLTTLDTNIGDDLIRRGITRLLRSTLHEAALEFVAVNKHDPYSVYGPRHPLRWAPRGRASLARLLAPLGLSRFDDCDLIVQCGAPVLWPGCHRCEWAVPVWDEVIGRLHERVPVVNIAAGSAYPWERQPETAAPEDAHFLRRIASYCRATTVRDTLAERLYCRLGVSTERVPCTAFLSAGPTAASVSRDTVLINFMEGGGHYGWDQSIDPAAWRRTAVGLIGRLARHHRLTLLCHDDRELRLAEEIAPHVPRVRPGSVDEYLAAVQNAQVAVCNRMHAAVGLASVGVPSVAVGTDTRMLMVSELGLPIVYVKDAQVDALEARVEDLLATTDAELERLAALKHATMAKYESALQSVMGATGHRTARVRRRPRAGSGIA